MSTLPTNIVRQGEPSRSALRVASLRAVHQLLDEPLVFPDRIALPLLGASAEAALRGRSVRAERSDVTGPSRCTGRARPVRRG